MTILQRRLSGDQLEPISAETRAREFDTPATEYVPLISRGDGTTITSPGSAGLTGPKVTPVSPGSGGGILNNIGGSGSGSGVGGALTGALLGGLAGTAAQAILGKNPLGVVSQAIKKAVTGGGSPTGGGTTGGSAGGTGGTGTGTGILAPLPPANPLFQVNTSNSATPTGTSHQVDTTLGGMQAATPTITSNYFLDSLGNIYDASGDLKYAALGNSTYQNASNGNVYDAAGTLIYYGSSAYGGSSPVIDVPTAGGTTTPVYVADPANNPNFGDLGGGYYQNLYTGDVVDANSNIVLALDANLNYVDPLTNSYYDYSGNQIYPNWDPTVDSTDWSTVLPDYTTPDWTPQIGTSADYTGGGWDPYAKDGGSIHKKNGGLATPLFKDGGGVKGYAYGGTALNDPIENLDGSWTYSYSDGTFQTVTADGNFISGYDGNTKQPLNASGNPIGSTSTGTGTGTGTGGSGSTITPTSGGNNTSILGSIQNLLSNGTVQGTLLGTILGSVLSSSSSSGGGNQGLDMSKVGVIPSHSTSFGMGPANFATYQNYAQQTPTTTQYDDILGNLGVTGYDAPSSRPATPSRPTTPTNSTSTSPLASVTQPKVPSTPFGVNSAGNIVPLTTQQQVIANLNPNTYGLPSIQFDSTGRDWAVGYSGSGGSAALQQSPNYVPPPPPKPYGVDANGQAIFMTPEQQALANLNPNVYGLPSIQVNPSGQTVAMGYSTSTPMATGGLAIGGRTGPQYRPSYRPLPAYGTSNGARIPLNTQQQNIANMNPNSYGLPSMQVNSNGVNQAIGYSGQGNMPMQNRQNYQAPRPYGVNSNNQTMALNPQQQNIANMNSNSYGLPSVSVDANNQTWAKGYSTPVAKASGGLARPHTHYTYGESVDPLDFLADGGSPTNINVPMMQGAPSNPNVPMLQGRQDYRAGAAVEGAGDGQSDDIPAMLADGEYVMDAEIVSALGNGSNKAGAKVLDDMRKNIRAHKRSGSLGTIPPKAKSPLAYMKGAK